MAAIAEACGRRVPQGENFFVVRERNQRPGKNHHVCADGGCYHFHAVLHWPGKAKVRTIKSALERIWPTPKGETNWNYIPAAHKQGVASARTIGLRYLTEPAKDKIIDPDGPLFYTPPPFGSKEWARLEAYKARPPSRIHPRGLPAAIYQINQIYGSFDKYWAFYEQRGLVPLYT